MKKQIPLLHIALNAEQSNLSLATALCFELPTDGTVPEWVPLIPVGDVIGRDGRKWKNSNPAAVIAHTVATGREQPLDYEHSTELKAPIGEEAPAAGWFKEYRVAKNHIEGRLVLNPRGASSLENREYRYLSPVFQYDGNNEIYDITSVAFTNRPNLYLPALNHQTSINNQEQSAMTYEELMALLRTALNMEATADHNSVIAVIKQKETDLQTARNAEAQPDLSKFVPVETHEVVLQRAMNAEQKLTDNLQTARNAEIDAEIDAAVAAGKIAPVNKEFYRTACNTEGGLDKFREFAKSAPVVAAPSELDGKTPGEHKTALNAEAQKIADAFGNTAEDLKTYGA
jgi:phage I-like protein